jgi:hypothetical protein
MSKLAEALREISRFSTDAASRRHADAALAEHDAAPQPAHWREHDNAGMRYPELSDLSGGATDAAPPAQPVADNILRELVEVESLKSKWRDYRPDGPRHARWKEYLSDVDGLAIRERDAWFVARAWADAQNAAPPAQPVAKIEAWLVDDEDDEKALLFFTRAEAEHACVEGGPDPIPLVRAAQLVALTKEGGKPC